MPEHTHITELWHFYARENHASNLRMGYQHIVQPQGKKERKSGLAQKVIHVSDTHRIESNPRQSRSTKRCQLWLILQRSS